MTALSGLSLTRALRLIAAGELSAREYATACIERVEEMNPQLNAFIGFDGNEARERFARVTTGPLSGIPLAVKDNIAVSGQPMTCGSRILGQFRPPEDATAVGRLRGAGAFVLGKTNLDEFAMGSSTEHSAFGVTRNPWDHTRVCGGSSGGSAAAVAAGMVPVALGSETGGSVRQPASFCGVIGLKPTYGRISRSGLVAFASSIDQIGIFARSADDCATVLSIAAGSDPLDATTSSEPVDVSGSLAEGVAGLRVGIVREAYGPSTDETRAMLDRAARALSGAGAVVEEVGVPTMPLALAVYSIVANAEASANLSRFDGVRFGARADAGTLTALYRRTREEGFGAEVKRRIMLGTFALSAGYHDAYYGRAQQVRRRMTEEMTTALSSFDLLLLPTTPGPAFRIGEKVDDPLAMYLSDVYTAPANLAGVPAISIPFGRSGEGLPLAIQFIAGAFRESTLLRVARWIEDSGPAD